MSNTVNNTNNSNNNDKNKQHSISVKNLVKSYDLSNLKRNVIDDISFDIDYGSVFGFLDPNGAGKTTRIKILTGILQLRRKLYKNTRERNKKITKSELIKSYK